jgi:hypothetical protein
MWAQVLLVTLCMAYAETTNILMLAVCGVAVVSLFMLECRTLFYDVAGWWPSLAVAGLAAMSFAHMHVFLQKVDQMERVAAKYAAADRDLGLGSLQRLESTEKERAGGASFQLRLGPLQVLAGDLHQPNSFATLESLLRKSTELGGQFEKRVLLPLFKALPPEWTASATVPTFNLKTAKRCREKTRLEYNSDFRQLKDTLRGSIICRDMADVWIVWKAVKQLEASGTLEVLQVKNRYRGLPMPGGYRDININVFFDGLICEVQMHTEGHYALKSELHPSYKLCRSVGLVGDIEGMDSNGTIANSTNEPLRRHWSWPVVKVGIAFLRWFFAVSLAGAAGWYFSLRALEWTAEEEGWIRGWKGMSLAIPCSLLASLFAIDSWDTSRAEFTVALLFLAVVLGGWYFSSPSGFLFFSGVTMWGLGTIVLVFAVLLRRQLPHRGPAKAKAKLPRIALLYSLYFGVDGTYFAWKSAVQQCFTVGFQAYVKLDIVGTVVSGPFSETMYWTLFAVLVGNIVLPPVLLSSPLPWVRREGAMAFDVFCDLFYTVGVNAFYLFFAFDVDAAIPVDIVAYLSLLSPCLRVLSVVRALEKTSGATTENTNPSRLPRKAAIGFGCLSLAGFALALFAERDIYPWNTDACRPCECFGSTDGLVLERCNFEGQSLVLSRRGITGIKAETFNAPSLRKLRLTLNDLKTLPPSAFGGAPGLKIIAMNYNQIGSFDAGAFRNLTMLEELYLNFNSLSSLEDFNGALGDMPSLKALVLYGNSVSCEDVQTNKTTWECYE